MRTLEHFPQNLGYVPKITSGGNDHFGFYEVISCYVQYVRIGDIKSNSLITTKIMDIHALFKRVVFRKIKDQTTIGYSESITYKKYNMHRKHNHPRTLQLTGLFSPTFRCDWIHESKMMNE